jgi:hypothetical protein
VVPDDDCDDESLAGSAGEELEQEELEQELEAKYGPRSQRYLRKRKAQDYSHLFLTEGEEGDMEMPYVESGEGGEEEDTPLATPHMNMKKGINM